MPIKKTNILAIDPGSKEIGVAIFCGRDLRYFRVKTFKQKKTSKLFLAEISGYLFALITAHHPTVLAIERTFRSREDATVDHIMHIAKQYGLLVQQYEQREVRQMICQKEKATRRETAHVLARYYPVLIHYLKVKNRWESMYWGHVFDAVAVGLFCLQETNE